MAAATGLPLGKTLGCLASALANSGDALAGALSNPGHTLLGSFANALESLIRALADLSDSLAGPFADLTDRLPGALADVLHRVLGAFADTLDRLAGLTDEVPGAFTHLFGRVADPFEQLRVAIERHQHALEDQADVVEPGLQQGLGLDALDLQHYFAQAYIGADADLHQIAHLRHDRNLCSQIVNLDVDFVDLDDGNIKEDVRAVGELVRIDDRVVGELAP